MHERREANRLPPWTESLLTPEQRRTVRRRFGLADDADDATPAPAVDPDDGQGGGTPAPTSPSAPAYLTRPVGDDDRN